MKAVMWVEMMVVNLETKVVKLAVKKADDLVL